MYYRKGKKLLVSQERAKNNKKMTNLSYLQTISHLLILVNCNKVLIY